MSTCGRVQHLAQPRTVASVCYAPQKSVLPVWGLHSQSTFLAPRPLHDVAGIVNGKMRLEDGFFLPLKPGVEIWVRVLTLCSLRLAKAGWNCDPEPVQITL